MGGRPCGWIEGPLAGLGHALYTGEIVCASALL